MKTILHVIPPSPTSAAPQPPSFPFPFPSPGWCTAMVTNSGLPSGWGFSCIPWANVLCWYCLRFVTTNAALECLLWSSNNSIYIYMYVCMYVCICSMLGVCWAHVGSMLARVEPSLGHVVPMFGPILALWRGMLGLCWAMLAPCWAYVEPCWAHVEPMLGIGWAYIGHMLGPSLAT